MVEARNMRGKTNDGSRGKKWLEYIEMETRKENAPKIICDEENDKEIVGDKSYEEKNDEKW